MAKRRQSHRVGAARRFGETADLFLTPVEPGLPILVAMPHVEVEVKFAVESPRALARRLRTAGFRRVTPRAREQNTLFDLPEEALFRRGELLRLRKYGSGWWLTHKAKGKRGRHKTRIETETRVADGGKLKKILLALGYLPAFRYEKFRAAWSDGHGQVVIDETPIGCFGEIEGPPRWIDRTARRLGISRASYITQNYAALFLAWKRRTGSRAQEMTFRAVRASRSRKR